MVFGLVEHSFLVCLVSLQAELNGGKRAFALEPSRVLARSDHWTSFITLRRISGPRAYKEMAILIGHGYLFSYNFQTPMERWMHHFYSSEKREWFRLLGKTFRIIWPSKVKDNCGKSRFYPIFSHKSRRQIIVDPRSWHNIGNEIKNVEIVTPSGHLARFIKVGLWWRIWLPGFCCSGRRRRTWPTARRAPSSSWRPPPSCCQSPRSSAPGCRTKVEVFRV